MWKGTRMKIRPMLAAAISQNDLDQLPYPLLASPKIDGIRCLVGPEGPQTRTGKRIKNSVLASALERLPWGSVVPDGELVVGCSFQETYSGVMSSRSNLPVIFAVFDVVDRSKVYFDRASLLTTSLERVQQHETSAVSVVLVGQRPVFSEADVLAFEHQCLTRKFEGVVLRRPDGRYKFGRSLKHEALLLKLKRFEEAEATVIGFVERKENDNTPFRNAVGYQQRSSIQEGKRRCGDLGSFIVRDDYGREFRIGSGMSREQRQHFWNTRTTLRGQTVTFYYQISGSKDKPRIPHFKALRMDY